MYCRSYTGTISHVLCIDQGSLYCVLIWESLLLDVPLCIPKDVMCTSVPIQIHLDVAI